MTVSSNGVMEPASQPKLVAVKLKVDEYLLYNEIAIAFFKGGITPYPDVGTFLKFAAQSVAGQYVEMREKTAARQESAKRRASELPPEAVLSSAVDELDSLSSDFDAGGRSSGHGYP